MCNEPNPSDLPSTTRLSTGVWLLFLVVLLAACWYKADENRRDRERQAAWETRIATLQVESREEYDRLLQYFRSGRDRGILRQELEQELNDGQPFDLQPDGDRQEAHWTHPKYAIPIELRFYDNKLTGWGMSSGSPMALPENAQPPPLRFDSTAEGIRESARTISVYLWVLTMLATFGLQARCDRKRAWYSSQLMLAAALVYGGATVVSPSYDLTIQGIFSNDPMFLAVMLYLGSLIALATTWPTRARPQFRLRQLLVAFTAAALLLAMGPLGYFALCVFAGGGLMLMGMLGMRREGAG